MINEAENHLRVKTINGSRLLKDILATFWKIFKSPTLDLE
jgi:hypothetical protein